MRIWNMISKGITLIAFACLVWGCNNANSSAPSLNAAGQHPATWLFDHRAAFLTNQSQCSQCHGSDLHGGISKVSCFTPLFNGQACHAGGPSGHPAGWREPSAHGAAAKSQPGIESGFSNCQSCHGANFTGGAAGVSCFLASTATGPCHVRSGVSVNAPHSPIPWRTYPSPTHTDTVDDAAGLNAAACALCHTRGANLRVPILTTYATGAPGCFNSTLCHGTTGHPPGWAEPKNHGSAAKANLTYCQQCHADKPFGGAGSNPRFNVQLGRLVDATLGNTGCEVCHTPLAAHPRVLQIPAVFGKLTTINPIGTPWYLHCKISPSGFDACTRCHGAALNGVGAAAGATSCTFCHMSGLPNTLLNCTSCHGRPPSGAVYPNIKSAHPTHSTINVADICGECHYGLGYVTLDHFNRSKLHTTSVQTGAVQFGAFTHTNLPSGVIPTYNDATQQCLNTYCHGATLVGGTNKSPIWSQTNYLTAAGCGTCHGFPPANAAHTGFTSSTPCKTCHPDVNATNTGFTDPTRHVNGFLNISTAAGGGTGGAPHTFPYPGKQHLSAAGTAPFSGCVTSGCHTNSSANKGGYPNTPLPTPPNPPDCQGCHAKASPGNSCGSCHGVASTSALTAGRPNGSSFPDVAGGHSSNHGSFACSVCHGTAGTGQDSHGSSGGTAHNDTNVVVSLPSAGNTITYTRSGLADGHGSCSGTCNGQPHTNTGNPW